MKIQRTITKHLPPSTLPIDGKPKKNTIGKELSKKIRHHFGDPAALAVRWEVGFPTIKMRVGDFPHDNRQLLSVIPNLDITDFWTGTGEADYWPWKIPEPDSAIGEPGR